MTLMMHQAHPHQPWQLDTCNPYIHSFIGVYLLQHLCMVELKSTVHDDDSMLKANARAPVHMCTCNSICKTDTEVLDCYMY